MRIEKFMTKDVLVLRPETTIKEAARIFLANKIDGAPVMGDDGELLGLLTKTHVIRALVAEQDTSLPVTRFMTRDVKTLTPEQEIMEVDIMTTGRYPVVKDGKLVGFITKSNIMVALNQILDEVSSQFETVIESAHNPIVAIDVNGNIRIWNRACEVMTRLRKEQVLGRFINEIIPESELLNVVRTGKREYGIKLRIGDVTVITNRAPIIRNGKITGAVAVLYDVSELEKVSMELDAVKALNAELEAIIEFSYDGLYITDGEGLTLRINPAIQRMTGLTEKDLVGRYMKELVETGVLSNSATLVVMKTKQPYTTTLTTVTGTELLVSATPVFDKEGNIFRVVTSVRDVSELNQLKQQLEQVEGLKNQLDFEVKQLRILRSGEWVFKSPEMEKVIYQALKVAEVDSTVLIYGPSGVGKEVIANMIHSNSKRREQPFIRVNCAAIPETLMEAELFGYEGGAFTGARKEGKPGLFEVADGGTLLLDEIGEIPLHLQVKLLRTLQEREVMRIGGTKPIKVDVRIIAVTNQDLESMVAQGKFREDLFYRLNVVPIRIPALRERPEEIPLLANHFLKLFNNKYGMKKRMDKEVYDLLMHYDWPGNIRELENIIERLVVTSPLSSIGVNDLPSEILKAGGKKGSQEAIVFDEVIPLKEAVAKLEREMLRWALKRGKSMSRAAELLGVDVATISRKANKYGLRDQKELKALAQEGERPAPRSLQYRKDIMH